ncbi:poly(ADP-ribose) polymerase, catalytic domain-containing protein [Artemisia annua]|uniref:Poly(ADP-ribose) polymerase, catalytic domain-containing protein n=1 Tax=Artemisia annua TaxID=35608 RepID=A0A2U1KCA9_ARTAN|nr:poly(ADP-ribose) polymerase, catalytic domain-containing protein [Artemisia annua]
MTAVELRAARVMQACCGFLRWDAHCGGKRTDVTQIGEERPILHRSRRRSLEDEVARHYTKNWFASKTLLETGDPSRNIIEMIFKTTTANTTTCTINIKQVLKLNNSRETLERFEKVRVDVKNRAYEHHDKDPRNMVDGNEQLLFYTKLASCKQLETSKLCKDSNCSICSIIKSGFHTAKRKTGIWLTTSCQDFVNDNAHAEMMNVSMAIMVCRVITGRVIDMVDTKFEDEYDSIEGVKSNQLFVKNPSGVLPCFVIVLDCKYTC